MKIPRQLQNEEFRFCKIETMSKKPFEKQVSGSLFDINSLPSIDRQNNFICKPNDIQVASIQLEFPFCNQDDRG